MLHIMLRNRIYPFWLAVLKLVLLYLSNHWKESKCLCGEGYSSALLIFFTNLYLKILLTKNKNGLHFCEMLKVMDEVKAYTLK